MRRTNDFYPTPGAATRALLERLGIRRGTTVLECCSGADDITRELQGEGLKVVTNDIDPSRGAHLSLDAARAESWAAFPRTAWVVTNPPFAQAMEIVKLAREFTRRQTLGGVAVLLRLSFLEPTDARGEWLSSYPPDALLVLPRISFTGDGRTDSVTCAWMVWRGEQKRTQRQAMEVVTKGELARLAAAK